MSVDIIDTRAKELASFFEFQTFQNLSWYNGKLSEELSAITRPSEQQRFLIRLRYHLELMCKEDGDDIDVNTEFATLIYAIEQFFDEVKGDADNTIITDTFSMTEHQEMISQIDKMLHDLSELKVGNHVLFEELQELKQRLDLGKKNWKQLLTGKLFDMIVGGVVDKSIGGVIYESLLRTKDEFLDRILA